MNAEERKRLKRAIDSKEIWKQRGLERQRTLRLQQLRIRDLESSRNHWKEKYFQTKEQGVVNTQVTKDLLPKLPSRELKKDRKKN